MNSTGITWFWPLSFLAALGQLLLLVTNNPGGPPAARFLLAVWTLWLPGVALGNLLTKPGTRLLSQLPIQASCALGVAFLVLTARAFGLPAGGAPMLLTAVALLVALVLLFLPGERGGRRRKTWELQDLPREHPAAGALLWVILVGLFALHLGVGSPLSLRPDTADNVAAARRSGLDGTLFPDRPFSLEAGAPGHDPEAGLVPPLVDAMARLTGLPHDAVWRYAAAVLAPLIFLAWYLFALAVLHHQGAALAAALAQWIFASQGLTDPLLASAASPSVLATLPFWTAAALVVEGLDRPHLPLMLAFAPVGLAVWGSHFAFGILLAILLVVVGLRSLTSIERLQEGLPLLLALWIPWLILTAIYLAARGIETGSMAPAFVPARGLLVLSPGVWIVNPYGASLVNTAAIVTAYLFLGVLLEAARRRAGHFALIALMATAPILALNPIVTPWMEAVLGSGVHYLPMLAPVGVVLVAEAAWAVRGITRGEGMAWARVLLGIALVVVTIAAIVTAAGGFAYAPARFAALRAAAPEDRRDLVAAAADTLHPEARVATDPWTASALAALTPVRSIYASADPVEARRRRFAFRDLAWTEPSPPPQPVDSLAAWRTPDRVGDSPLAPWLRDVGADAILSFTGDDGATGADRGALETFAVAAAAIREDTLHARTLAARGDGVLLGIQPPGPGPRLPRGLATEPGPDRPPASLGFAGPVLASLDLDTLSVVPGVALAVRTSWRRPPSGTWNDTDPRGYRVRLELVRLDTSSRGFFTRVKHVVGRARDFVTGRPRGWAVEAPLVEGRPVLYWDDDRARQTVVLAIPPDFPPGRCEIRAGALPGPVDLNVAREGLVFLPRGDVVATLDVLSRAGR